MQAGIITEENIAQILRGISQKRRHGVLEVHTGERVLDISFFQGKIVNFCDQGKPLARSVAERLIRRETIATHSWASTVERMTELAEQLSSCGEDVPAELLALVVSQQALETLYTLRLEAGSYYHFRVEIVPDPSDQDLQLSVGQLLLDLVSLKDDRSGAIRSLTDEMILARGTPQERDYTLEEQDIIWLVDGEMTIAQLRARSLLNVPTFDSTVYSLLSDGVLERRDMESSLSAPLFDMASLDASIDQYVDEALGETDVDADTTPCTVQPASSSKRGAGTAPSVATEKTLSRLVRLNENLLRNPAVPEFMVAAVCIAAAAIPVIFWF